MGTDNICATWIQVQFCSLVGIKGWFVLVGADGCSPSSHPEKSVLLLTGRIRYFSHE